MKPSRPHAAARPPLPPQVLFPGQSQCQEAAADALVASLTASSAWLTAAYGAEARVLNIGRG
jgi:hypothetical protein